jgi:ribosomal protein L37AE/L43A
MSRNFQRTIEDFSCIKCGAMVSGDGYTNHCSNCLHSRHVDVNPGDRASPCGGLMKPVGLVQKRGAYVIEHQCVVCGFRRVNRTDEADSTPAILALARRLSGTV